MYQTSGRLLALLGLLQSRTMWRGDELASRLQVSGRTLRNDIERLRQLDYPVEAVRGPGGHTGLASARSCHHCCWTTTRPSPWRLVYAPSQE